MSRFSDKENLKCLLPIADANPISMVIGGRVAWHSIGNRVCSFFTVVAHHADR